MVNYDLPWNPNRLEQRFGRIHRIGQTIEVKGRIMGADTVTVTKNEILTALNKPEGFILALVQVPLSPEITTPGEHDCIIRYIQQPFEREPDFDVTSVNYNWRKLWERGSLPKT